LRTSSDAAAGSEEDQGANDFEQGQPEQPSFERHEPYSPPHDERAHEPISAGPPSSPAPVALEPAIDSAPTESAPPRRRSTVREPAPVALSADTAAAPPSPPPQPVELPQPIVSATGDTTEQPRRSGWWRKR
jgi:ribonuclease E